MSAENKEDFPLGIKSWSAEDRPREKLLQKGKEVLTNAELLAILLGSGTRKLSAVDLAKQILKEHDNRLSRISQLSVKELCKFPGIGEAKAVTILAAAELGNRRQADKQISKSIKTSRAAFEALNPFLADLDHERFFILLLNQSHHVLRAVKISQGGVSGTVVDPKVIFRKVFEYEACTALILGHNHPSGRLVPSKQDEIITQQIVDGAKLLSLRVLDHIIVGNSDYYSFLDAGKLPK
mgnify:CR=1 FL=1